MIRNEFQSTAFRTSSEMLAAIAFEFLSAGGVNDRVQQVEILSDNTDAELAAECIDGYGLDMAGEDGEPSHMSFNEYTATELAAAFTSLRV